MISKNKDILQVFLLVVGTTAALFFWHFVSKQLPESLLTDMDDLITYAMLGVAFLMAIAAVVYLYSNLLYEIYTQSILKRANQLLEVSIDKEGRYLYVVVDCYQSGDESSPGFYIYRHYIFEIKTGVKSVYKATITEREDNKALVFFNSLLKQKPLNFKLSQEVRFDLERDNYRLVIRPFKNRIDFGFEITCFEQYRKDCIWRKKI